MNTREGEKMDLRPIGNKLIIRPDLPVEKAGSIILSDYSKKRPTTGVVIAMGDKVDKETFKVGQRVVYGDMAPYKIKVDVGHGEEELYLIHPEDIWAIAI